MKRKLMAQQWDQFARLVLPQGVSDTQRQEMRRAFYAGAQSILMRVIAEFAPESEPTEEDLQMMQGADDELQEFARMVKEGRA